MEISQDELAEAKRQIDSTLHKLQETIKTFESKENAERGIEMEYTLSLIHIFMDNAIMQESITTLFRYTLIFGSFAVLFMFFLAKFAAKKIVQPLEESYQRQKQFISDAVSYTHLDVYKRQAKCLEIEETSSFVNGIRRDMDPVKKAIELEYSNGLAEGNVNKIKVVKRIMYGRNSFELL